MAEPRAAPTASRVLVATDAAALSAPAVEAGAGLAAALGARLEALFVESADLLRLGGLPFATEISAVTGAWRDLAVDEIERAFRVEGARLERLVAQAAQRANVPWSFDTARGRLLAQAVAREAELTILGVAGRAAGGSGRARASSGGQAGRGSLAVLFDASPASFRALEVARQLAVAVGAELRLLVPPAGTSHDVAALHQARAWLAAGGRPGVALPLRAGEAALDEALRSSRSELLVHAVADLAQSLDALAGLVARLSCPLLIVRSGTSS